MVIILSTVRACMAPQVSLGNLAILVHVARPYTTESQESLHLNAALFVQQSHVVCLL